MIEVDIDASDLASEFSLTTSEVGDLLDFTVQEIAVEFKRQWSMQAKNVLGSTREEYIKSLQVSNRGPHTTAVFINPGAWLPNALEMGYSSFDMKTGFLSSPNVKKGKSGPFLTIPFRFAQSGSVGESSVFSGVLPKPIQGAVKQHQKTGSKSGLPLSKIPGKYHIPKSASMRKRIKSISFDKEKVDTTSIYQGVKKSKGGYVTFRRVSLNSSEGSWIHPGFEPKDLATKALGKIDIATTADMAVDQFLVNLGF